MYEYLLIFLGSVMLFLGAFMFFKPEQSTQRELRDSKEAVQKIKKNGGFVILCGFAVVIVGILIYIF